jgi:hypothetical protein
MIFFSQKINYQYMYQYQVLKLYCCTCTYYVVHTCEHVQYVVQVPTTVPVPVPVPVPGVPGIWYLFEFYK